MSQDARALLRIDGANGGSRHGAREFQTRRGFRRRPGEQQARGRSQQRNVQARLLQGTRRTEERGGSRYQEGVPSPCDEIPSGSQSRRSRCRSQIQGSQGSLRCPHRPAEASGLRPARPRRRRSPESRQPRRGRRCVQRHLRRRVRGYLRRPARRRWRTPGVPRCRSALRTGARSRSRGVRLFRRNRSTQALRMRNLPRERCGQGQLACEVRDVRWPRSGANFAGLLPASADVPQVPWRRHHRAKSVRHVSRPGTGAQDVHAQCEGARGRRHRRSHSSRRRRRGRPQTAVRPEISMWRSTFASTRSSSAMARI